MGKRKQVKQRDIEGEGRDMSDVTSNAELDSPDESDVRGTSVGFPVSCCNDRADVRHGAHGHESSNFDRETQSGQNDNGAMQDTELIGGSC